MLNLQTYQRRFLTDVNAMFHLEGKDILEVGCGDGCVAKELFARRARTVVGIDPKLSEEVDAGDFRLRRLDVQSMPFGEASFDYVFSIAVLEHVEDVPAALNEIHRVLRKGGIFFARFGPIWTAINGRHYRIWDHANEVIILPWSHLFLNRDQMFQYLAARYGKHEAEEACQYIYDSKEINRLSYAQYNAFFGQSRFPEIIVTPVIHDRARMFLAAFRSLLSDYSDEELLTSGFTLWMRK